MLKTLLAITALAVCATICTGCPSCPYDAACQGNTLHTCWVGVDQIAGDPAETWNECEGVNPVCQTIDDRNAQCVINSDRTCGDALEAFCENGTVVSCVQGFQVAEDCVGHGNACAVVESVARCAMEPPVSCDDSHRNRCEGHSVIKCVHGYEKARDCEVDYGPSGLCTEYDTEQGASAYCVDR